MNDVENERVSTVIVKDQSRLGRDYLQTGLLMEITFPQYDVRFIAVNDGVDSINGVNDFAGIKNYFNDLYHSFSKIQDKSNVHKSTFPLQNQTNKITNPKAAVSFKQRFYNLKEKVLDNPQNLLYNINIPSVCKWRDKIGAQ